MADLASSDPNERLVACRELIAKAGEAVAYGGGGKNVQRDLKGLLLLQTSIQEEIAATSNGGRMASLGFQDNPE